MTIDAPLCAECQVTTRLVTGRDVYPGRDDLAHKWIWRCDHCRAYVGCHGATMQPLGTPAGPELRRARQHLHAILDPIWKGAWTIYGGDGQPTNVRAIQRRARSRVYEFLAFKLGIAREASHTAQFDLEQCRAAWVALRGVSYAEIREWSKSQKGIDQKVDAV